MGQVLSVTIERIQDQNIIFDNQISSEKAIVELKKKLAREADYIIKLRDCSSQQTEHYFSGKEDIKIVCEHVIDHEHKVVSDKKKITNTTTTVSEILTNPIKYKAEVSSYDPGPWHEKFLVLYTLSHEQGINEISDLELRQLCRLYFEGKNNDRKYIDTLIGYDLLSMMRCENGLIFYAVSNLGKTVVKNKFHSDYKKGISAEAAKAKGKEMRKMFRTRHQIRA